MKIAIYPGSFDPITNGHIDIIERSSKIFDALIVAVNENEGKSFLFDSQERIKIIEKSVSHLKNVEVKIFNGLLVDFVKREKSNIIIRGLRVLSDFEYEFKMALMNRNLDDDIDTMFMMTHDKYTHVSSSIIKEVAALGGDIAEYVPEFLIEILKKKVS
tara:strand:+ start:155 stop:631 length:477 start_codon:yes stop_codon:yes gene_type:complete